MKTVIQQGITIHGEIKGEGDLDIAGAVLGDVEVTGDVVVEAGALVKASISSSRITVRGAVRGELAATTSISLEDGARVVGDVAAPSIAMTEGALMKGKLSTGDATESRRPAEAPRARPAPPPARAPLARPAPPPAAKAPPPAAPAKKPAPPPPVVPQLKKGAKAQLKKRAGG